MANRTEIPPRKLTSEEETKANRAQTILWVIMIILVALPFIVAWLTGSFRVN